MKIAFVENQMNLVSSGACNLMMEWVKLLRKTDTVDLVQFGKEDTISDGTYFEPVRQLNENPEELEDYQMIITNNLGSYSDKFRTALMSVKKPITYFVYHDRSVIRDVFTELELQSYMNACDYILTYQPMFLLDKLNIEPNKILPMDVTCFYKDPENYKSEKWDKKFIDFTYCNRTNNFKGAYDFMKWCKYLKDKNYESVRLMKGFHPDYPHENLKEFKTIPNIGVAFSKAKEVDFLTENYGPHEECLDLLMNSKFVWCAQNYDKFGKYNFKDKKEYMSYLNYDLDGTTLEAIFSGCIPILHIAQKYNSGFISENHKAFVFYDPDKGFDDLYNQIKNLKIQAVLKRLREITDLYKAKEIFSQGLRTALIPPTVAEHYKSIIAEISQRV